MKSITKLCLSLALILSVLALSVASVAAAPLSLFPASEDGYTVVSGDGSVELKDGAMLITNNGDTDLRITIDNTTSFDLTALPYLHMVFNTEAPFKMAYHVVCDSNADSGMWPNTSNSFPDLYEVDTAKDSAAAGEYDVKMDLGALATDLADTSSVHFDQFILVLKGKGTFTLTAVEMTDGQTAGDDTDGDATTAPKETTTTVKKSESADENPYTGDVSNTVALVVAVAALGTVVTASIVKKQRA